MTNVEYTSDRVAVVRCKDCKYSINNAKHIDLACECSYDDPDFYCANGERREDNA